MSTDTIKSVESKSPLSVTIIPAVPTNSRALVNKNGKTTGHEYYLGAKSASQLKEEFKALGKKGNDLKALVNAALASDASARKLNAYAAIEHAHAQFGMLPDTCTMRKNSMTIKALTAGVPTDSEAQKRVKELEEKNAASEKAIAEMREQINTLMAAKQAPAPAPAPAPAKSK